MIWMEKVRDAEQARTQGPPSSLKVRPDLDEEGRAMRSKPGAGPLSRPGRRLSAARVEEFSLFHEWLCVVEMGRASRDRERDNGRLRNSWHSRWQTGGKAWGQSPPRTKKWPFEDVTVVTALAIARSFTILRSKTLKRARTASVGRTWVLTALTDFSLTAGGGDFSAFQQF